MALWKYKIAFIPEIKDNISKLHIKHCCTLVPGNEKEEKLETNNKSEVNDGQKNVVCQNSWKEAKHGATHNQCQ